jgi:hypothetical protein
MTSPVVAVKTLSVKTWEDIPCSYCHETFDIERQEARMAPDVPLVVADTEKPYAIMDDEGYYTCPHCQQQHRDEIAAVKGESSRLLRKYRKNKKIGLTLLVHPDWLKGAPGKDEHGLLGGNPQSSPDDTIRWNQIRIDQLDLVEVRGKLPDRVSLNSSSIELDAGKGNITSPGKYVCQSDSCGLEQAIVKGIKNSEAMAPVSAFMLQCFSPKRKECGMPYSGRYFKKLDKEDARRLSVAEIEWNNRCNTDLKGYWPTQSIPFGHMTHQRQPLPDHGYKKFSDFFNARQLLVLSQLLKAIQVAYGFSEQSRLVALGALQQYIRNQCMMSFWHIKGDKLASFMSNANYHPKNLPVESSVFPILGLGNWESCSRATINALEWKDDPWELVPTSQLATMAPDVASMLKSQSFKVNTSDEVLSNAEVHCCSSTELEYGEENTFDLVITDPPFGDLLHYSELADFFYVWLQLYLRDIFPEYYSGDYSPKTLEAVSNKARHPDDPDGFYKRLLTECWREANKLLKPGGILSFTFHHSEDEPWLDVLESLFEAGYYLEATYPIRSDETKGKGEFGSKTIEYDIIHVCRKRIEAPRKISWARLRRQILSDVRQLQSILEHHQNEGLPKADIQVIKRGKALEYFSRHYGQVYVEEGREFTVKEALVGINQLLDDQAEGESGSTPVKCEPISRQFLRIFHKTLEVPRDQMQKYLRGTGIGPSDFVSRGWSEEKRKVFHWVSPLAFAQERVAKFHSLHRDLDQAMVLVGACFADSGINVRKLLSNEFKPHPALGDLLNWWVANGGSSEMRNAATTARQLYSTWAANNQQIVQQQLTLFDME